MGGFAGYPCCTFRGSLSALDVNDLGADFDLSAPPMLVRLEGRELLVVPQKSGIAWALDPERLGRRLGRAHRQARQCFVGVRPALILACQVPSERPRAQRQVQAGP